MPATEINTVVTKGPQGQNSVISTSTRLAAARGNDVWMRVVMLAPSASDAMSTTVLGDTDMTLMRGYFIKPQTAIAMTFSEDPMMGMTTDRFSGSATGRLATQSCCWSKRPTASTVQPEPSTGPTWNLMFKSQVERCWRKPLHVSEETSTPEAAFAIRLKRDRTLKDMPVPEKSPTTPINRVYQDSALRAIIECQPYSLPAAYFNEWKYLASVFTERQLS